jgi:hypothetical protein
MNPKLREELSLVMPLADALQMRLNVKSKLGGTVVSGEAEFWMDAGAVKLLLRPKVLASLVRGEFASVLVKVRKRLWIHLTYFKKGDYFYLLVLDANAIGLTETTCITYGFMEPDTVYEKSRPGIVGEYLQNRSDSTWKSVRYADHLVDQGRSELPQEESRITGTPV